MKITKEIPTYYILAIAFCVYLIAFSSFNDDNVVQAAVPQAIQKIGQKVGQKVIKQVGQKVITQGGEVLKKTGETIKHDAAHQGGHIATHKIGHDLLHTLTENHGHDHGYVGGGRVGQISPKVVSPKVVSPKVVSPKVVSPKVVFPKVTQEFRKEIDKKNKKNIMEEVIKEGLTAKKIPKQTTKEEVN